MFVYEETKPLFKSTGTVAAYMITSEYKMTGYKINPISQGNATSYQNIKEMPGPLQRAQVLSMPLPLQYY